ncbi:MAG: hypothetical protein KF855_09635 [Acidobacteria bacterium]|nr:hypothetical protein [Acidobacteriota bacterium]
MIIKSFIPLCGMLVILAGSFCVDVFAQTPQNPSPMTETTRPHPRIEQTEVAGRRVELTSLKGARLFVTPRFRADKAVPLIIHFHGAPWLIEHHIAKSKPKAALITVQLGSGSRVYGEPFLREETFTEILAEAERELGLKKGWSSVTLTGFSAGYGSIRAIMRHPKHYARVDNVLLLDGLHASYVPENTPFANGGVIKEDDLDIYVTLARDAADGKKNFVFTHSEIFPGTFVSTTEAADHLIAKLGLKRKPVLKTGPLGMQQLSTVKKGGLNIIGYAGNTGPDHGDHLHAIPAWFKLLKIR